MVLIGTIQPLDITFQLTIVATLAALKSYSKLSNRYPKHLFGAWPRSGRFDTANLTKVALHLLPKLLCALALEDFHNQRAAFRQSC